MKMYIQWFISHFFTSHFFCGHQDYLLNKDKGKIGSFIFQERHCQPRADLCFPPVVRYESNLNEQKWDGAGDELGEKAVRNVAESFNLDVCPHCNNWFVFVLRRVSVQNMARGLERHVSVWLTKHCSILSVRETLSLRLQRPSGCAQTRGPDATLILLLQLRALPLAHTMRTRSARTFSTVSNSNQDPTFVLFFFKHWKVFSWIPGKCICSDSRDV